MLIDGKIVILIEHQSTINKNMPFRFLEYIARIYEKITTKDEKFGRKLVKLPIPEFYVFYNGPKDFSVEFTLKLSDAFLLPENNYNIPNDFYLEIIVKVFNINVEKGQPILQQCKPLQEYSDFVHLVRTYINEGKEIPLTEAVKKAVLVL